MNTVGELGVAGERLRSIDKSRRFPRVGDALLTESKSATIANKIAKPQRKTRSFCDPRLGSLPFDQGQGHGGARRRCMA